MGYVATSSFVTSPTVPSAAQANDLLLCVVVSAENRVPGITGWTLEASSASPSAASQLVSIFSKTATSGDPGTTLTIANLDSDLDAAAVIVYSGTGAHVGNLGFNSVGYADTSATSPSISVGAGSVVVTGFAPNRSGASGTEVITGPATVRLNSGINGSATSGDFWLHLSDTTSSSDGSTAPLTASAKFNGSPAYIYWQSFTLEVISNTPPNAPSWVTPQNSTIPADQDAYLEIAFSDPDPGDSMSASNWKRWTLDGTGARVAGSEVDTYQPTPSTKLLIAAGTLTAGTKYEFQADTLDSPGAEGPYGASLFITAATTPASPTFTDPISGQTIGTASYTGVISDPTADESEWTLYADDGSGSIDTSTILQGPVSVTAGDVRRNTFTGLANNVPVWWSVRVKYQGLWSQPTQIRTPVSYSPPAAPQVTVTPAVVIAGLAASALDVAIANPAGTPAVSYNDVYIDDQDGQGWVRKATMLAANTTWRYQTPRSGVATGVKVVAIASNGTSSETVVQ